MAANDPIQEWLRRADAAAGAPPALGDDLPGRLRRLAAHRRRTRAIGLGVASAAAAVVAGVMFWMARPADQPPTPAPTETIQANGALPAPIAVPSNGNPTPIATVPAGANDPQIARLNARLAEIRFEIDWRRRAAREVEAQELALAHRVRLRAPDPQEVIRQDIDTVALVMVRQADRLARQPDRREAAVAQYRRTVEFFPQSPWAAAARQRLTEIIVAPKS
jgi:hypothetical protein